MISSSVMAFISSSVYPRYVNSFLRRVSTRPARARDGADRGPAIRMEGAELSRRELNDGPVSLAHHDGLGTRGPHESTAIPGHRLDVVDERPFWDVAERHRVPAVQVRQAMGHGLADGKAVAGDHED